MYLSSRVKDAPHAASIDDSDPGPAGQAPGQDAGPALARGGGSEDARDDLSIDITAGFPFLTDCNIAPEALVRYRAIFEHNDADGDGLLNVNQLHVALTVLSNHTMR